MRSDDDSADPTAPERLGPELLAHLRGELTPERHAEIDRRLAGSEELRSEREGLARDHEAWQRALDEAAPSPRPETLRDLLAAVAEEAAERRAAASAGHGTTEPHGPDAVALALDHVESEERARVESLVAGDESLAAVRDAARRLADATHEALAIEPGPEALAELLERVAREGPAPVRFDTEDVPPPAIRRGGRLRVLGWLAPLAAVLVLAIALQPTDTGIVCVTEGPVFVAERNGASPRSASGTWVNPADGPIDFDYGAVLGAGASPVTLRIACGADGGSPAVDGPLTAGDAELTLEPGARLRRIDAAHFELLEGRMHVEARELTERLEIRSDALYATVTGTRFEVAAVDERLFVVVEQGEVRLGRRGDSPASVDVGAGEQGLADAEHVLRAPLDGRSNGDAFLTPQAALAGPAEPVVSGDDLVLEATLTAGDGGPVTIAEFDASVPLFLVRLTGPEGREHEIKIQESMLQSPPPTDDGRPSAQPGAWRLTADRPYALGMRIPDLELEPGRWRARLRYMSYRGRPSAPVWLGAVESAPITIEVRPR